MVLRLRLESALIDRLRSSLMSMSHEQASSPHPWGLRQAL